MTYFVSVVEKDEAVLQVAKRVPKCGERIAS
jgi:hypothetical protein